MALTKEQIESELESLKERFEFLKSKVDLLEILAKSRVAAPSPEAQIEPMVKVKQINAGGKRYFCKTIQEQQIFAENNPGVKTESFDIELQSETAKGYLEDPENIKQFTKKENQNG